jgi:poly-gamma-glutamate synthesis protein (capsule biosynthesis protein)
LTTEHGKAEASLIFAGDFYPAGLAEAGENTSLVYGDLLPKLLQTDFAVANLECPLTMCTIPIDKAGPNLKAPPSAAEVIGSGNFRAVSLANNHILDYGAQGLEETQSALTKANIRYFGAGDSFSAASSPLIIDVKGIKVGLLAACDWEFSVTKDESPGANPIEMERLKEEIPSLRPLVDVVIICVHAGNEMFPLPSPFRKAQYHRLVDYGAHAVIGHHPHVVQGIERYRNSFIFYSLGNFFFPYRDMNLTQEWYKSYLVELKITRKGVTSYELLPVIQSKNFSGIRVMEGRLRENFTDKISRLSKITMDDGQLGKYWDAYCLRMFKYFVRPLLIGAMKRTNNPRAARLMLYYRQSEDLNELIKNAFQLIAGNIVPDRKTKDGLEGLIGKITWKRKIESFLRQYMPFQDLNFHRVVLRKIGF